MFEKNDNTSDIVDDILLAIPGFDRLLNKLDRRSTAITIEKIKIDWIDFGILDQIWNNNDEISNY